jgi:hypothetical protein
MAAAGELHGRPPRPGPTRIKAKPQPAYARTDRVYAQDDAAAKADLAEARGYPDAAAEQSKHGAQAKAEAISRRVDAPAVPRPSPWSEAVPETAHALGRSSRARATDPGSVLP